MIFGIGLPKTGNTSLATFLKNQGFNGIQYPNQLEWFNLEDYDFCVDTPCNIYYQMLYKRFPKAKFIYTYRNEKDWLVSWSSHLREVDTSNFRWWQIQNRNKILKNYPHLHLHKTEVEDFFRGKPAKLFWLNLDNLDVEGLCDFLGLPISKSESYPHRNRTGESSKPP